MLVSSNFRNGVLLLRVGFSQQLIENEVLSCENNSKFLFIQMYVTSNWCTVAVLNVRAQTKTFSLQLPTVALYLFGLCYLELRLPNHAAELESSLQHL